jgi:uncharacterized protein (DUF2237 family)
MNDKQKNVLGEDLEECSNDPLTGWYRDGCCSTDENDHGVHTVCASWYVKAVEAGKGCPIYLKRTHEKTLKLMPIDALKKFAIDLS